MDILEVLKTAPERIETAGQRIVACRKTLDHAKAQLKAAKAKAVIKYADKKNAKLTEAHVDSDPEVIAFEAQVIEAQGDFEAAKLAHEFEEDKFVSARKLTSIDERIATL